MLQLFRNIMKSKLGVGVVLAFLVIIALAFGIGDVASNRTFGGVAGGDRVAVVGSRRISTSELSLAATNAFQEVRQKDPTLTMQAFIAQGGLPQTLDQLISRNALAEFGRKYGLEAGKRLVDSELTQVPAFQGPDGRFDPRAFAAVIGQRQLSEAAVRDDFATNVLARQLLAPLAIAPAVPASFALRYAALLTEHRKGSIALLPSTLFAPAGEPSDAQVQGFYQANRNLFLRPERRVIRYAAFNDAALGVLPPPSDAQIAQRYQRDRAKYAASEKRTFTQLVLPTEAAAAAIVAEVKGGKSLAAAAQEKGLRTAQIAAKTQPEMVAASSAAIASAGFTAAPGALIGPLRGGLGWFVLHLDKIDRQPARSLDQARGEIVKALLTEQRTAALADMTAKIEQELDDGKSLAEVAAEHKLTLAQTEPVTADGKVFGKPTESVPPVLTRAVATAFEMEEGKPQLAETVAGQQYLIFDVPQITPAAVAPLAEVRNDVVTLWKRDEGAKAAKAAADAVAAKVANGANLADAVRAVKPNAPATQTLDVGRQDLAKQGRVPAQMALFFTMASGSTKTLEAPLQGGWFVIKLDAVQPGQVSPNDAAVVGTQRQIAALVGDEYIDDFIKAAQRDVGVTRNQTAITALQAQLSGHAAS